MKRFHLDIDRASWVVEMAFEWMEDKNAPIPDVLLQTLTRGLFVEDEASQDENTFKDFASALLENSSHLRLNLAGQQIDVGSRGIKKLAKTHSLEE